MVQRKVVNKLGIRAESLNSHTTSEKRSAALKPCHQHQDSRNKGGVEIKKKMKKSGSFKSSDFESLRSPMRRDQSRFKKLSVNVSDTAAKQKKTSYRSLNYMKPTSSSDARRESLQLQVSPPTIIPDKSKKSRNSNRSKPSSASSLKPMKVLMRKSSLRPVWSSTKKSCGVALYPNLDVNRATCSSTLKDSKFPMYVDLHPGGTESEGTSVMKVCPYTYCSLNGHHHVPSPPLKHFLAARRRLLKTQKSMKLKGLSGDRTKEIDTGQMVFDGDPVILESDSAGSAISPLVEVHTDFFVEIFANPRGEIAESVNYGDARKICNGDDGPKLDFAEIPQVLEEASSDDNDEKPSPASSESTETDIEEEDEDTKSQFEEPNPKTIDGDDLGRNSALSTAEMDVSMTFHEDDVFDQEEEAQDTDILDYWIQDTDPESPQPNELDDVSVLKGQTYETSESEMDHLVIAFDYSQEQVLQSADVVGDEAERKEGNGSYSMLKIQNPEFSETCQDIANENHTSEYINMETEVCQSEGSISQENKSNQEVIDPDSFTPDQSIPPATQCTFDDQPGMHNMDKNRDSEKDQAKIEYCCISKSNCFEQCDDTERYGSTAAEDCIVTDNEMQLEDKPKLSTEEPYITADNIQIPEKYENINAGTNANEPTLKTCNNLKGKPRKAGKRPIENEQLKKFNPRAPQYLDLEPDPEAEKVDLRHQMVDERKNAEEWMIDYALQQAVTKLAPARKHRVALLVEAFETVIPLPKFEAHLQHSAPSFTHSRPIQACS